MTSGPVIRDWQALYRIGVLGAALSGLSLITWRLTVSGPYEGKLLVLIILPPCWLVALGAWLWVVRRPWFTLEILDSGRGRLRRSTLMGSEIQEVSEPMIAALRVVGIRDSDDDPDFVSTLTVSRGEQMTIARGRDRGEVQAIVDRLKAASRPSASLAKAT